MCWSYYHESYHLRLRRLGYCRERAEREAYWKRWREAKLANSRVAPRQLNSSFSRCVATGKPFAQIRDAEWDGTGI